MVKGLLRNFKRSSPQPYQLSRLVDARRREDFSAPARHLICDIDKTYLETEFESLVRMARIAFEAASDKVTVAGASEVLLYARWDDLQGRLDKGPRGESWPRPLHFVSSSPPQLRTVLEEKLMMDGLDWTSETFKNQAYNLRMGRMDLLRQHVAYKSQAILNLALACGPGSRFYMIGDNAESDAYIYVGVKLALEGRLTPPGYRSYLEIAGVEPQVAADLAAPMAERPEVRVDAILIRNVPGYTFVGEPPLTEVVRTFDHFYQAALLLMDLGMIEPGRLWTLTRDFHNHHGLPLRQLAGMLEAVVGQEGVSPALAEEAGRCLGRLATPGDGEAVEALRASLARGAGVFEGLGEGEILEHARQWMHKLQAEKGR